LLIQAVDRKRCASCQRWEGDRQTGPAVDSVSLTSETITGLCLDGGWHGAERRARSACGHWQIWSVLLANLR